MWHLTTIIKCGTWQPVKFQLVSRSLNEMIFYRTSELMLLKLIQRYDKIISVLIQFKHKTLTEILQTVRCHILELYLYYISIY